MTPRRRVSMIAARRGGVAARPEIVFRITESRIYPIDRWHMRRALVGGWWSREYGGFTAGSTLYGWDCSHAGSDADCRQNASLSTATRIAVTLGSGAQTATQVATSIADAIEAATSCTCELGAPYTVDNVECIDLTIIGATGKIVPPTMPFAHEAIRGMWGVQRTDYGTGSTGAAAGVNATASYHFVAPAAAHRVVGAYSITGGGAASIRLGVADGPAYSTTPAAFSNGVEANAGQASTDGTRVAPFSAVTKTSAQHVWVSWRGTTTAQIRTRAHGSSPVGNGDAVVAERILSNATPTDPTTAIYTAGAYTHVAPSNFAFYPAIGYLYEMPDGSGNYYSTSNARTLDGYHRILSVGDGANAVPGILAVIHESFRRRVPWPCRVMESGYFDLANNTTDEDAYLEAYDWTAASSLSTAAPTGNIPKTLDHGRANATTGGGRKTITTAGFLAAANAIVAPSWHWGRVGGGALTTVTTRYDVPGAQGSYPSGWEAWTVREGSEWCDMTDSGETQGTGLRGVDAQYLTSASGDMPVGTLVSGDDPFDVNAADTLPDNHFRHAISYARVGIA